MQRNDSSINPYQKVKKDHLGYLFRPVSQIDVKFIMLGFLMEDRIIINYSAKNNSDHCSH